MTATISVASLLPAPFLLVYLAFKGHSVTIIVPIVAIVAVIFSAGSDSRLTVDYTGVHMIGFVNYVRNYFPLYLFGAILAKLVEVSGCVDVISHLTASRLGKERAILAIVLYCAVLTYGGTPFLMVTFVALPIAISLFRATDVPKRLIPGSIALRAFVSTMTALPGSPQIRNTIPMTYFGTNAFVAPILGIIATIMIFSPGIGWLSYRAKKAKRTEEGYGDHDDEKKEISESDLPGIIHPATAFLLIVAANSLCSKVIYPYLNTVCLEQHNTKIGAVSGNWSVPVTLFVIIIYLIITGLSRFEALKDSLEPATGNSLMPLVNSYVAMDLGSVIKGLAIFTIVQALILSMSANPLITEVLAVNLLCGMTAFVSNGLGATLEALAPTFLRQDARIGIGPQVLHRIAPISSDGLDSLSHNGTTVTILSLCGITRKEEHLSMFVVSVVIPIATVLVIVVLAILGLRF